MHRGPTGSYLTISSTAGERVRAFVPQPLPPTPALLISPALRERLDSALIALGRLDAVSTLLPDTQLFLYMYVRKEAVLSSQIEGTQSSLSDLLLFEADELPGVPIDDVTEVSNYVRALDHGIRRVREGFPISNRLFKEIHEILLAKGRGSEKQPGEFRRSQNWIGGSRLGNAAFIPPPPDKLPECLGSLERWLHDKPERSPTLIKAALAHVQFETIHPFLDGNGRVGRLIVTLLLCAEGVLRDPLLYVSLYLKQHRMRYYELLDLVRQRGDWEAWLEFFVAGVHECASSAVATAQELAARMRTDAETVRNIKRIGGTALRVLMALQRRPIAPANLLSAASGVSIPAVNSSLTALENAGIVREITGRKRNRVFSYAEYVRILNEGTEPIR